MQRIRRGVRRAAGAWLIVQLWMLVWAPTVLCGTMRSLQARTTCPCAHVDPQSCPMHQSDSSSNAAACSCRNSANPFAIIVASLFGPSAVLTGTLLLENPLASYSVPSLVAVSLIEADILPPAPPPRA